MLTDTEKNVSPCNCLKIHGAHGTFPRYSPVCSKQTLLIYIVQKTCGKFNLMLISFHETCNRIRGTGLWVLNLHSLAFASWRNCVFRLNFSCFPRASDAPKKLFTARCTKGSKSCYSREKSSQSTTDCFYCSCFAKLLKKA